MSTWNIDIGHSELGFKVKHLLVSTVKGHFTAFEGTLAAADDTFEGAKLTLSADIKSVSTNNAARDGHLLSGDFFEAEQFPKLTFVSKSFTKKDSGSFEVTGDLTMRGVTKEVAVHATLHGIGTGMDGKRVAAFEVTGKINRMDFGVKWNSALEAGGFTLGEEVMLDATMELKEA